MTFAYIALLLGGVLLGFIIAFVLKRILLKPEYLKLAEREKESEKAIREKLEAEQKKLTLELKEELSNWKGEYNRKHVERINKLNNLEKRLIQKEENLDSRYLSLDGKEKEINKKEKDVQLMEEEARTLRERVQQMHDEQLKKLEKISGMTTQEAKEAIIHQMEGEARLEAAQQLKTIEREMQEKSVDMARDIIANSVQRIASEHVVASSVTVVDLPNDEMKGRIIGREGRNIRALENATGVDFIVDDTPEAILISSFDPVRREIAKQAMQMLILDGRIHPARVEEVVEKVKTNFDSYLKKEGEAAVLELGIENINPELYYYLGKLKFRSSFGQNVLQHAKEVALIAAMLARELGLKVGVAKRAGLLHDIGKAIDRETEGTHTELSVDLVKRYGESKAVQDAIASHHMDCDFTSIEGILIQVADTISAARPGARREILETYIKRLEKLEELSKSFTGVNKAFAFQAGREVRVIVNANELDDNKTYLMSKDIAKKVQEEMEYPGQIKVTVIREVRAIEYAK